MYEAFYGLKDKPFSMLPDPGFLYLSKQHQTALTLLEYALVNKAGFCVVTGEPGAGKTTLLRKLLETVEDSTAVGMITNTHQSFGELLDWVLSAFNIHEPGLNKVQQNQKFTDYLLQQYAQGKSALLIVDEAQNMKADTLEELRMLSNVNSEKDQLLQVILAGQPALKHTLRQPELMQFAQRIGVDYHLDTLNAQETCNYIQHRLVTAGASEDVFTPKACLRVFEYSGGTPRLINLICDTAMVYGFADQTRLIDADIIDEMVQERMRDSVVPLFKDVSQASAKAAQTAAEELDLQDDITFPWINPEGGTAGLKPQAEKKTPSNATAPEDESPSPGTDGDRQDAHTATDDASGKADAASKPRDEATAPAADDADAGQSPPPAPPRNYSVETVVPVPPQADGNKWWFAGIAVMLLALVAVLSVVISNNREIERLQREAEQKLQQELQRKEQAAAELARKLEREQQEKRARERELQRQAERLQKERDAALEKARLEEQKRARQQQEAELIRKQKEAEKLRLKLEAEKRQREIELKLKREQEKLAQKLRLEQQRLERIRQQQLRIEAEKEAARRQAENSDTAAQQTTVETDRPRPQQKQTGFSSDPCSGPSAKFLSSCR